MTKRARKAWNGGSKEAAMTAARQYAERAIASGCERCPTCEGKGLLDGPTFCLHCSSAGFFVPEGGMPALPK
jgi:hypothetical protein